MEMKQFGQKIKKIVNKTKSQKLDMVDRLVRKINIGHHGKPIKIGAHH
jgi:hypothetical protein